MNVKVKEKVLLCCLLIMDFPNLSLMMESNGRPASCVPIRISICQGIGYFLTSLRNYFNHTSQEEAELEIHQFVPLIKMQCSKDIRLFLCSMYTPICIPERQFPVLPCHSFCNSTHNGCAKVLKTYGFEWPEKMNCKKLPEDNECFRKGYNHTRRLRGHQCSCRSPLIQDNRDFFSKIKTGGVDNCLMNCRSPYFPDYNKRFPALLLGILAGLCIVSTSICIFTFCIDASRSQYPERPIFFLSICYLLKAVGYLLRVLLGHEAVACNNDSIQYGSSGALSCSIVFIFIYFSDMAAGIWWVILMATWFLIAGLKCIPDNIGKYSHGYHVFAWSIPGMKSIYLLIMNYVGGDPVSGICYVGNTNKYNLLFFVIIPLTIFQLSGSGFLLAGLPRIINIRKTMNEKRKSQKSVKFEKLMVKIGIFGIISFVPALILVLCNLYEFFFRDEWERSHTCSLGKKGIKPEYSTFMIKVFMNLVIGTGLGFWVWSRKTLELWRMACHRLHCGRINNDQDNKVPNKPLDSDERSDSDGKRFVQCEV